jgi:DNA processing protein
LTYRSIEYPRAVYESYNPVEVLYVLGPPALLAQPAVACVGSRGIRDPYADAHASFARVAAGENVAVASGFATGADRIGHEAAWEAGGTTVCVMPCGLDRPFPPENRDLWTRFLASDRAVFVTEFPFGTGASSLTLRKRNKLIVAVAAGVLVSQSSAAGGAMNAFRFAVEQRKPVATFEPDDTDATSGNQMIGAETKVPVRVLPAADEMAMSAWLHTLSFST